MTLVPSRERNPLSRRRRPLAAIAITIASAILSACGGGAGDGTAAQFEGPSPVEPVVGVWNVTGHGSAELGDPAFMIVETVDEDGEARVRFREFDEERLCYLRARGVGRAMPDGARGDRVFTSNVAPFDGAELVIAGGGERLDIRYFDAEDVDGDGDRNEQLVFSAPRETEAAIAPSC